MARQKSQREQARREWVVRQEVYRDAAEAYEARRAAAETNEQRRALMDEFAAYRRTHRAEDIRRGKRPPGLSIAMHQIMWARWAEVAVEHELEAREAFAQIVERAHSEPLLREFRASLVAVTAAAHTIEALFGDIKYLIPVQARQNSRDLLLWRAFRQAFGISEDVGAGLRRDLAWLFDLRGQAVHPYTESEPTEHHPAGINTGVENSKFNAVTSGRAVDIRDEPRRIRGRPTPAKWQVDWTVGCRQEAVPRRDNRCAPKGAGRSILVDPVNQSANGSACRASAA